MSAGAPVIALLGGECSGKTTLAQALQSQLQASGVATALVPETLRTWVASHGRTPDPSEQHAIAQAQAQAIERARERSGVRLVLADTTPVMTAAYSELYFGDTGLWPQALDWQRSCAQTWLMGTDLPWRANGQQRDGPPWRERADALLRERLLGAGLAFQTFHGGLAQRLAQAWRALAPLGVARRQEQPELTEGRVPWRCDSCSDPDCEHRLFGRLLSPATPPR